MFSYVNRFHAISHALVIPPLRPVFSFRRFGDTAIDLIGRTKVCRQAGRAFPRNARRPALANSLPQDQRVRAGQNESTRPPLGPWQHSAVPAASRARATIAEYALT